MCLLATTLSRRDIPTPTSFTLDKRFKKYALGNTPIQRLYHSDKILWAEGPAWNGVGRYLLWSDIHNNVQNRWLEEDGHVSVFRNPAGNKTSGMCRHVDLFDTHSDNKVQDDKAM